MLVFLVYVCVWPLIGGRLTYQSRFGLWLGDDSDPLKDSWKIHLGMYLQVYTPLLTFPRVSSVWISPARSGISQPSKTIGSAPYRWKVDQFKGSFTGNPSVSSSKSVALASGQAYTTCILDGQKNGYSILVSTNIAGKWTFVRPQVLCFDHFWPIIVDSWRAQGCWRTMRVDFFGMSWVWRSRNSLQYLLPPESSCLTNPSAQCDHGQPPLITGSRSSLECSIKLLRGRVRIINMNHLWIMYDL